MKTTLEIPINDYLPLRDVVFQTLRRAILKGELEPGQRLLELHLAEKLGVSRTPIREAIHKLEQEGLVVMVPRRGAVVASITEKDLQDVLEVRRTLERMAAELACERISEQEMQELRNAGEHFRAMMNCGDLVRVAEADVNFHETIYHATGNQRLIAILSNLREQMYRYRVEYLKDTAAYESLDREHEMICRAICRRDREAASQAIREHIDNQKTAIMSAIREND